MLDDLKHYKAEHYKARDDEDLWQLIPPELAGGLFGAGVVLCLVLDGLTR